MVAYEGSGGRVAQTTELTHEQHRVLKTLDIQAPRLITNACLGVHVLMTESWWSW